MKFAALLLAGLLWASGVSAQTTHYVSVPTTPDLSVTAAATAEFLFEKTINPAKRVHWIAVRNDCLFDIYIGLRGSLERGTTYAAKSKQFPIRLSGLSTNQVSRESQSFSGPFIVSSVVVSNSSMTSNCKFQLIGMERSEN